MVKDHLPAAFEAVVRAIEPLSLENRRRVLEAARIVAAVWERTKRDLEDEQERIREHERRIEVE